MKLIVFLLLVSMSVAALAEQIWLQPPNPQDTAVARSFFYAGSSWNESADGFVIDSAGEIIAVEWWGHDSEQPGPAMADFFMIRIYADSDPGPDTDIGTFPGDLLVEETHLSWTEIWDDNVGQNHYFVDLQIPFPYLPGIKYWISFQVVSEEVPTSGWGIASTPEENESDGYYANNRLTGWQNYDKDLAFGLYSDESSPARSSDWTDLKSLY